MLISLSIKNYALIDSLEINFEKGFSVITGETGAGKSILLGAMTMLLGKRTDISVLKESTKKCVIEGSFFVQDYKLQDFFLNNDIDYFETLILRREINPQGRSRVFINDQPASVSVLKELSPLLIDIHSQHKNLELGQRKFQLAVTDFTAKNQQALSKYQKDFSHYTILISEYEQLCNLAAQAKNDSDYLQYRFNELENANLKEGELETLEKELEIQTHAEDIQKNLNQAFTLLQNDETGIVNQIQTAKSAMQRIKKFHNLAAEFSARLKSIEIEANDLSEAIETSVGDIEYTPQLIEKYNNRINVLNELAQKHKVNSDTELIKIKDNLKQKLKKIGSFDKEIAKKDAEIAQVKENILKQASLISTKRQKSFPIITKEIATLLSRLGMPNAKFEIQRHPTPTLTYSGCDAIKFLFSANKNTPVQEISKVASGGEISRLMLSIKFLISKSTALPTIIFDEIDTGVSGDIAHKMGDIMKLMAQNIQVIAITHLPQIASKAQTHYLVYKEDKKNTVSSSIKILDTQGKTLEIAKMLSGENITEAALENARVLLSN